MIQTSKLMGKIEVAKVLGISVAMLYKDVEIMEAKKLISPAAEKRGNRWHRVFSKKDIRVIRSWRRAKKGVRKP